MKNLYKMNLKGGFTLIELLVVIAIIGILASTVLVSLSSSRSKAVDTRVQAEVVQLRTQLEQNFANGTYTDLEGSAGNVNTLVSGGPGYNSLVTLLCDIGKLNGYPETVSDDIELECEGVADRHTGVVIYSNEITPGVSSYGIYATTTLGGYVCVDSYGNVLATTSVSIPDYGSIVATSTALCQ